MAIKINFSGIFKPEEFKNMSENMRKRMIISMNQAMDIKSKEITKDLQSEIKSKLKIKRKGFLKAFRAKLLNKKNNSFPAIIAGATDKIPWLHSIQTGYNISKLSIIPLFNKKIGPKSLRLLINKLNSENRIFSRQINGKIFLYDKFNIKNKLSIKDTKRLSKKIKGISNLDVDDGAPFAMIIKNRRMSPKVIITDIIINSAKDINIIFEKLVKF